AIALTHAIARIADPPRLRIVRAASGATTAERYGSTHTHGFKPGDPLVLIVRGDVHDIGDSITVVRSERRDRRITVEIESRRFHGPHTASGSIVPLAEIELGALAANDYTVVVRWTGLQYSDPLHPERATDPKLELQAFGMPLEVR
nr:hypothetical protein [Deltaproteobacteria bacterium]